MANGKATGREAVASLMTKGEIISGITGALAKGVWYYVISRDDSSLIPANVSIGRAFLCSKAVAALAAGDSVYPLSATVIGFTRDKSLNASKTVTDATTDLDDEADNISDGLVSRTGSLTGYDTKDTATATLKAAFNHSIIATAGAAAAADALVESEISTPKQIVMIDWTGREKVEGEDMLVDIFPCIFTSMDTGASYGSVRTLGFNFTVVASDDDGCKPTHFEGPFRAPAA